ncbi:hypothetical protein BH11MYX1_BH11MYX1_09750 [soil metagenome]
MEYIEGRDVRRILRHARKVTGPAPIHVTTGLALQLCEALDYAHTKLDEGGQPLGLVHRDISPSNLLVTHSGHLKVIDFGIAKAQSSQLRTQTGRVKGKLAYMAPEAISGSRDLDSRSDVWACGVILHELLTARPLFASKNEYQTLMKVQRGDIMPPSTFNQTCPPELEAIVFKALAREPDDRFASALEMRDELVRVRTQYALQTSHRDISTWLDRAFALEQPDVEAPASTRAPTPRPVRDRDDDEAVEMVWGNGEGEGGENGGPIVLDDVPDVSEKHLAVTLGGDSADDIPAHRPSHGSIPRAATRQLQAMRAPTADVDPDWARSRPSTNGVPAAPARDSGLSMNELFAAHDAQDAHDAARTHAGNRPPAIAVPRAVTQEPVVRFSKSQRITIPPSVSESALPPLRPPPHVPHPKPNVQPAAVRARPPSASTKQKQLAIGEALAERKRPARRWPLVVGLGSVAGGAAAVAVYVTTNLHSAPATRAPEPVATGPASVDFDVAPKDAEIRIDGVAHSGVPWQTKLAAGTHQIEIRRSGYTAYLTSLALSPRDKHSLHIELRPLGTAGSTGEATLSVQTTPSGLDAELDGNALPQHTPVKLAVKPGSHTIIVKRGGVEIWRQTVNAEAASEYEFNPSFLPLPAAASDPKASVSDAFITDAPAPSVASDAVLAVESPLPVPFAPTVVMPTPAPMPPAPVAPPALTVVPTGPVTVAPNAVAKRSGEAPNISRFTGQSVPAVAAAKLCIDTRGNVSSVEFVGKIDPKIESELTSTLRTWTYAPYVQAGTTLSACFVVTMRMK